MDGFSLLHALTNPLLVAQAEVVQATEGAGELVEQEAWGTYLYGAMFVLGIFVLPFVLGTFIAKAIRMPTHSFRIGVMLAAIFAGLLFAWGNNFKLPLGPDFAGGTNLVYDIVADENGERLDAGALATALSDRINPSGTKEITIRPRGESQIEIVVPGSGLDIGQVKKLLKNSGQLEFRIVANTRDHADIIALAKAQAAKSAVPKTDVLDAEGEVVGRWYTVGREGEKKQGVFPLATPVLGDTLRNAITGEIITVPQLDMNEDYALEKWMAGTGIKEIDVLMALESLGKPYAVVTGDDLASAQTGFEKTGQPVVEFRLNAQGASKMLAMTARNIPEGDFHRRMAIIMDKKVLSAPQLNSPISNSGQITGRFTKEEVDFLVTILRSGRLPATLSEEPASEQQVGAGLGATSVRKGTLASIWAVAATFVCILLYYRFSGVVASLALIINGLLIFGVMVFIRQPLTLPGLAGLVLTVGMSVDANVLIFERIREEKNKGSAPRMAIRNGFDRAFTTIIDSNLTTLIAAIVLYWIGTDQVRGFAVALVIGIATSMFTATFCSRIVFEIAEKLKFVNLSMSDGVGLIKRTFFGDRDLNFMSWQKTAATVSVLMIATGLAATIFRGRDLLNIDFTGGTSVTFQLESAVDVETLREVTRDILDKDENDKPVQSTLVRVEKEPADTVYQLVTSIDDVQFLSKTLLEGFAKHQSANLVTYRVKVLKEKPTGATSFRQNDERHVVRFVAYQNATAQDADAASTESASESQIIELDGSAEPAESGASDVPEPPTSGADEEAATGTTSTDQAVSGLPSADPELNLPSAEGVPAGVSTELVLEFSGSNDDAPGIDEADRGAKIDGPSLIDQLLDAAEQAGVEMNAGLIEVVPDPLPDGWRLDDVAGHSRWVVKLPVDEQAASTVIAKLTDDMQQQPKWLSLSQIGTRVAGEMQQRAVAAILLSLVFIVAYIWFRFQKVAYGLAAVVALVHDVVITLGILALCHWLAAPLGFLLIEDFKIGLTEVAAFLTIIGYSLNDTIVVFDRIREVRGRSPKLTAAMINDSVNQTLSRTLLTSGTTLLTVLVLYTFGGEGIHAFSFALLVGILVGTYSSIFIAAPVLLWISNRESGQTHRPGSLG